LLELVILGGILYFTKETLASIGITKKNLTQSMLLGVIGAIIILTISILINGPKFEVYLSAITFSSLFIFIVCAIGEELIVRGYITNRLNSFTNNFMFSSTIAAFLFAFSHYAVKWGISGIIDFSDITPIHFVLLIILHFLCDFVYKKTNCIWGSAVLHILYNVCSSALIFIS
jgi:membrane protease YdiL (CAAX protease family)